MSHLEAKPFSPDVRPLVHRTKGGTPYLQSPGVALMAKPTFYPEGLEGFLSGFEEWSDEALGTPTPFEYINDFIDNPLPDGTALCKFAGQLCYMSFGEGRTRNVDAERYFGNVFEQAHGSILEHANYTFLLYGIGRDVTHELVRHRAGFGFSQVSQRYVSGRLLRFVERLELQGNEIDHDAFLDRIDDTRLGYDAFAERLMATMSLEGKSRTEARKAVNQVARAMLTNEVEAPILVTANVRAWRHCIAMRASKHADTAIRRAIFEVGRIMMQLEPILFGDLVVDEGNFTLTPKYPKV